MGTVLPDLSKLHRLLIIRLSSIGDVCHALPISAALAEAFPHLEMTWIVEEMSAPLVIGNPYLKDVIVLPRARWKRGRLSSPRVWSEYGAFLADLRRRRFDITLDLQGYAKSALMALAAGAPYRFGWQRLREGAQLVSRPLPHRSESLHRVDWFLDVARALGAEPKIVRFPLVIPEAARRYVARLLDAGGIDPQTPYAVLNPAVGDQTRRWGAERYAELANLLAQSHRLPSVLIGSSKDTALCTEVHGRIEAIRDALGRKDSAPVNLAGKTDLKELAAVLEGCAVHVCGDTGSAHIAAALERPVIALYGPTDPAHAGPWGQLGNALSRRELCSGDCVARRCAFPCETESASITAKPTPKRRLPLWKAAGARSDKDTDWESTANPAATRCLAAITPQAVMHKVGQVVYHGND